MSEPCFGCCGRTPGALVVAMLLGLTALTARADPAGKVVRFVASDEVEIVGDYYAPMDGADPAAAVVLVHMMRTARGSWGALIPALHGAHFAVLSIDLRGHGASGAPAVEALRRRVRAQDKTVFHDMHRDVEAAVVWLLARPEVDKTRIGLVGAGVGWSVALQYAVEDASVDAVVGLTPGRSLMGIDSMSATLVYGNRPMLLLAVETDRRAVETLARMNSGVVSEIVGNGTGQGSRMLSRYAGLPLRITSFLSSKLGGPHPKPVVFELGRKTYFERVDGLRLAHSDVDSTQIRWFSSAAEAHERGFSAAR